MVRHRVVASRVAFGRVASSLAFVAALLLAGTAAAQDRRQNQPGKFDFYVLSLSWAPTFCDAALERAPDQPPPPECGPRAYPFVVHGLWPQYETGFPEFCQQPAPRLDRNVVSSMLDLMPAPRLIFNEWDRHGTCSGLNARAFFETVRKARALVKIPDDFIAPAQEITATPAEIADAFVQANPGLTRASVAIACDAKRLTEVRICVGKDLKFHECADVEQHACRRAQVVMPPLHGERKAAAVER
ncbi:MAG TPA: ribonuclease T2 [Xanthobacteraceae bacterium]